MLSLFDPSGTPSNKVVPITDADAFFGKPEVHDQVFQVQRDTKCAAGCLALRMPDPPAYAPPSVCAISKDGRIAAVGGKDVELQLWSTETGELLSTLRGHEVAWTSSTDSTFFVTVQEDSKVYVYDSETLKQRQLLGHPEEGLTCASVSMDDLYVVVGGARGTVFSWDADSGVEYRQFEEGHTGPVSTVMCYPMPDNTHVIISCGAADHTVAVWDLEAGTKRLSHVINELDHAKNLRYHISKDGTQVIAWCTDSVPFPNLVFLDALNGNRNSVFSHDGLVRHAVFAKDAARIISCGSDGKIVMWDTVTLEPLITMSGHVGNVLCCGINEEGSRIVSSGEDCTIRVWSTEDGAQLMMMAAQDEPVKMCAYAKSMGAPKLLTCDMSGRVYVWNVLSEIIASLIRRFADTISAIALSPDSRLLLAGTNTGRVMLWDAELRENIWEYSHHAGRVECVAFNSLRDLVATAGADGHISLIAVDSGKQVNAYIGEDEPMMSVSFSPDDEKLAGVSTNGKLLVYDVNASSREARLTLQHNLSRVTSCVWSPNSKLIAGTGSDGCVMVWSSTSGDVFTVLEGDATATCCAFDVIGKLLAVGNVLGRCVLYNLETAELILELRGNASPVVSVSLSPDNGRLTTVCSRQAIIWDTGSGQKIRTYDFVVDKAGEFFAPPNLLRTTVAHAGTVLFDQESEAIIYDMLPIEDPLLRSFYLSDTRIITGGSGGARSLMVWSAAGNTAPDKFHTTYDAITSCHFSLDDRLVAMGTQDGNVVIYDVQHSETVQVIAAHQNGPCRCVRLSHDNSQVLSCGADAKVILWDWRARNAVRIYSGHFISIGACDIAFQDNRVVSGDNHGMISVWEKDSGVGVQTLPLAHAGAVLSVSMSSDGSTVASVGADDKVSIWNVDAGVELISLTTAIESHPLFCAFSADGSKLAVTESNGAVMVWNTVVGCQWYHIPGAHRGKVTACAWSFDCRRFATCGADSVMAVWDAESGAPLHRFPVKAGTLTTVAISPQGRYVAGGSATGTLSVCNIPQAARAVPEPSFLYHWMANKEPKQALPLYTRLLAAHQHLPNIQDAQGWSLISHVVAKGNAQVAHIITDTLPDGCGTLGLISAVPFAIQTRVQITQTDEDDGPQSGAGSMTMAQRIMSVSPNVAPGNLMSTGAGRGTSVGNSSGQGIMRARVSSKSFTGKSFTGGRPRAASVADLARVAAVQDDEGYGEDGAMTSPSRGKSFTQAVKRVAVELFTEKRDLDHMELIMNNCLALALNSRSSECVQVVLDCGGFNKISWGSYHAITDMIPSLAVRYPYMCYQFLAQLQLVALGDLEVPVAVMRGLDSSVIRTAPIFTNVRQLWQSHLRLHEVRHGPQPYAHVKASMVRLPFACAIGKDSLLQTLVESDVPVQVYGTPTLRAVIRHKWRLYARSKLTVRSIIYCFYCLCFTVFGILFSMEDHSLSLKEYWDSGPRGRYHLLSGGYLMLQAAWFAYTELSQVLAIGPLLYFRSGWNFLDALSVTLMLIIIPFHYTRFNDGPGQALAPMIAFEIILTWFKVFFYALAFEPTGHVVHMVFQIGLAVVPWAILLFMNIVAFGVSLMVLFQYTATDDQFLDFGKAIFSLWNSVFGVFDIGSTLHDGEWRQIAIILFSFFLFISNIVLLNMLIALMRDIYQQVRDTEQDVFLRGRAQLIVEVETLMTAAQLEGYALMPPYIHMLTQVQRKVHNSDSLAGRLERVEALVKHVVENLGQLMRTVGMNPAALLRQAGGHGDDGQPPVITSRQDGGAGGQPSRAIVGGDGQMAHGMGPGMGMQGHMPDMHGAAAGHPGMGMGMYPGGMLDPSMMAMMGGGMMLGPDGQPMPMHGFPGMMAPGMMGMGGMGGMGMMGMNTSVVIDPNTGAPMTPADQMSLVQLTVQRLRESDSQLPAILRQIDRLQRTINNQEMRMEGVVIVLRDIENLLRNQQPVIIHQESRPAPRRNAAGLTEAELEQEVKRLLGKGEQTKL